MTHRLSRQQNLVLAYLASGYTEPETAYAMGIALTTVKNHVQLAYRTLGVHTRTQAYLELGWLTPPALPKR